MIDRTMVPTADCASDVLARIELPLENLAFAVDRHLHMHANFIDPSTRDLLVAVREGVRNAATVARSMQHPPAVAEEEDRVA